jgi:hypothetical protein
LTSEIRTMSMEQGAFSEAPATAPAPESALAGGPPSFAGLDAGSFPGQAAMDAYKNVGFSVTGVYLTHSPARSASRVDTQWIAAAANLAKQGWGLAPIYVGAEPAGSSSVPPPDNPIANAQTDAAEAIKLAQQAGLEPGRTIFLDVEKAFPAGSAYESYVLKWLETVRAARYGTALYCFSAQTQWCAKQGIKIWTVHLNGHSGTKNSPSVLTPPLAADPIDAGAIGTQGRFYCRAAGLNTELDYDRWLVADPSSM